MRFKVFYVLFIISAVLYANYRLPFGVTPRHLMTLVMFLVCRFEQGRFFMDKWFATFLFFVVGFGISSFVTDYFSPYIRYLLGFYFVAYVGYWATRILVLKYNGTSLLVNLLVLIGLVDATATIGQFYHIPAFLSIPSMMNINVEADIVNKLERMDIGEEAYGISLPGIMVTDIYNGYFLMVVGILSLFYCYKKFRLSNLIPWAYILIASFMVQQRGPFYLFLLATIFVFYSVNRSSKNRHKSILLILLVAVIPFVAYYLFDFLLSGESRFNIGLGGTNRDSIYARSIDYISNNFIFGGVFKLFDIEGFAPHNLFLNAWIYGGIMGFIAIVVLVFKQCWAVIKFFISKLKLLTPLFQIFGIAFICFIMNSLLHNVSIVTGDLIVWLLWGVLSTYNLNLKNKKL